MDDLKKKVKFRNFREYWMIMINLCILIKKKRIQILHLQISSPLFQTENNGKLNIKKAALAAFFVFITLTYSCDCK